MGARRLWLRVTCVEGIGIWPLLNYMVLSNVYWKPEIDKHSKPYPSSSIRVGYPRLKQSQWWFPNTGLTPWWVIKHRTSEKWTTPVSSSKKNPQTLSDSEIETAYFIWFIVIESLEVICQALFSIFLIGKVISWRTSKNVKKTRNGNFLVEVHSQRKAEIILKMETFLMTKSKAYLNEKFNTSKVFNRSQEQFWATAEEIRTFPEKQGVTDFKRITMMKGEEQIQISTYILIFNQPKIPKEVKLGIDPRGLNNIFHYPWGASNVKTLGTSDRCKVRKKDLDHSEEDCSNKIQCPNCRQTHTAFSKSSDIYKREQEIQEIYNLFGSKEDCRVLYGRKHFCYMETGPY